MFTKKVMLHLVIKERISLAGLSQAQVADSIGTTPTQFGLYLRGDASLRNESLEKCLNILDINVETYHNRYQLAKEIAEILVKKGISMKDVIIMPQEKLVSITGRNEVNTLINVNEEQLKAIMSSKLVDYESTYPHFRLMVAHFMSVGDKFTISKSHASFAALTGLIGITAMLPIAGGIIGGAILSGSMLLGALMNVADKLSIKSSFMSPLALLTLFSVKKNINNKN